MKINFRPIYYMNSDFTQIRIQMLLSVTMSEKTSHQSGAKNRVEN